VGGGDSGNGGDNGLSGERDLVSLLFLVAAQSWDLLRPYILKNQ
jgi:hypothetical protein